MKYKGLNSDMNLFSKFVFVYETEIKHLEKADDFLKFSTRAAHIFRHEIQPKVKNATRKELKSQIDFTKHSLFFTKSKAQILDFCRHLRNSFVHANLEKQKTNLVLLTNPKIKKLVKVLLTTIWLWNF